MIDLRIREILLGRAGGEDNESKFKSCRREATRSQRNIDIEVCQMMATGTHIEMPRASWMPCLPCSKMSSFSTMSSFSVPEGNEIAWRRTSRTRTPWIVRGAVDTI